jgi:Pregnancy-associated plasma protein-A
MGLYHPFEGGCSSLNDAVDDTPAELEPAYGCPRARDTCKGSAGRDSVDNYMSYVDDKCMRKFTRGQGERMYDMWALYRAAPRT